MTRTRFAPWLVFACISALVGCSTEGDTAGNTELNVLIPSGSSQSGPGAPSAFDIQQVEYTITCDDGVDFDPTTDPDIDSGPTLDNDVTISGVLEVLDTAGPGVTTQDFGPDLTEVYVWQGFMDLPETAGCTVQLRARDGDGEVICTSTETFDINADQTTKVNVLMFCGISYQAPVGMLDLDGDFSFNVANYCPDLFVLNCIDSEPDLNPTFGVAVTGCQVRFRDADSMALLAWAKELAAEAGYVIMNVDANIVAERPKMGPHIDAMRARLAECLGIDVDCVSVKAKTNEGVGPEGRGEAISTQAVALVKRELGASLEGRSPLPPASV